MYKGFIPRALGIVPMRFVFWGVQGTSNDQLKKYNMSDTYRLILAGIIGGSAQTLVDNPIETMKIRQMTSKNNSYKISKNILFLGFGPTLMRNAMFAAIMNYNINISLSEDYTSNFLKSATGGFVASIITQPLDYIKTEKQRITLHQRTIKEIIISDYKHLMVGALSRAILGFFNMGIGFTVYSSITKVFINNAALSKTL